MDPITKMTQEYMKLWRRFRQSGKFRLFRIDTDPSMHQDLWRLFRAVEMAPDNRSPYLMFDGPFANPAEFYRAAVTKFVADYNLLREGLGKDGVSIRELQLPPETEAGPEEWFVRVVHAMWDQVKSQFEYLMIIFLPERIGAKTEWPRTIERLLLLFSSSSVRVAAADTPDAMLAELCTRLGNETLAGRFFIPSSIVQEYLFKIAAGGWEAISGNNDTPAKPTAKPAAAAASTRAPGTGEAAPAAVPGKILPHDEAARLRTCMAKAATASAERKTEDAIQALREARAICQGNELPTHEAIILIAIANSFLARKETEPALVNYEEAIASAAQAPAPVVVMQARLGMAAALFHAENYRRAAESYEQAAEDALAAESEIMHIEALRMAGTCHNIQGRIDDAVRCWSQALGVGPTIYPPEINASTINQVGQELVNLCEKRGLIDQAKSVKQQINAIKQQALSNGKRVSDAPAAS
jgi:tetratricopeptide (TPR) repeat protein